MRFKEKPPRRVHRPILLGLVMACALVLRASGTEMSWVPVGSDGPFTLSGADDVGEPTMILLAPGLTHRVEFELRANGWLIAPGSPHIGTIQATLDGSGLLGVNASPPDPGVDLVPINEPPYGGFAGAFQTLKTCHRFDGQSLVSTGQRCDTLSPPLPACPQEAPFCLDNPAFIFSGILASAGVSTADANIAWGAASNAGICRADEEGRSFYAGTLIFDVPATASSTYSFGFDPALASTFLNNCAGTRISGLDLTPGHVAFDCNENGIADHCDVDCGPPGGGCDVAGCGESSDCNADAAPDECQIDIDSIVDCSSTPPPCDEGPFFCQANCAADGNNNGIPDECEGPVVEVLMWESAAMHGAVGEVRLPVASDGSYTEPRVQGVNRLIVTYADTVNAAGASASVTAACDADGLPVDLSGITIGTSQGAADEVVITFSPKLPGSGFTAHVPAKYQIRLTGVTSGGGTPVAMTERVLSVVLGDAFGLVVNSGDARVNASDNGLVRSYAASAINPIDPANTRHVRSDVFTDGKINASDNGLVRSLAAERLDGRDISLACP